MTYYVIAFLVVVFNIAIARFIVYVLYYTFFYYRTL